MWLSTLRCLVTLACGLLALPLVVAVQQTRKIPRIGILAPGSPPRPRVEAFQQALRDLGYVEGQTITLEIRWNEGKPDRNPALAAELVALNVDVMVAGTGGATGDTKAATRTIPIVMAAHPNPVERGHVTSLARPGGNIMGVPLMTPEMNQKRLELVKEAVPGLSRAAVLWDVVGASTWQWETFETAARRLGVQLQLVEVRSPDDLDGAFAAGLPVAVVNPRHARDVANATGQLAQTDSLDARALALFADAVRPVPCPWPDAQTEARHARRARRRQRIAMRTAEPNRRGGASQRLRADIQAPMTWLDTRLATLDDALATTRRASPVWREHEALLRRVPGMGPVWTRTLWLDLPELGTLSRPRLAALVGVATFHRDSGTLRGTRTVWGGRTHVGAAWSMSPLVVVRYNPVLKGLYQRLRAAGKAAEVALTAGMRNL